MKKNLWPEIKASWLNRGKKTENKKEIKSNLKFVIEKYNTKIKKV